MCIEYNPAACFFIIVIMIMMMILCKAKKRRINIREKHVMHRINETTQWYRMICIR